MKKKNPGLDEEGKSSVFSVREAKAHFSSLVERAAGGEEFAITWHGRPKARLVPYGRSTAGLAVDLDWLNSMPIRKKGPPAERLVRQDREGRG